MEWVPLDQGEVTEHWSNGLFMLEAARLAGADEVRVHVADVEPGGRLGLHPTRLWQLFCLLSGTGWVRLDGQERQPVAARQAILWAPGDRHESGSETGMTVLIVQSSARLPNGG